MIQRIQTLYLVLAAAAACVMLFLPLAWFGVGDEQIDLYAFSLRASEGVVSREPSYIGAVLALVGALCLTAVFLYKRRMLQLRLCVVAVVLFVGVAVMLAAYYFLGLGTADFRSFHPVAVLPLLGALFAGLAARAIFRDEMLVRSLNRIR